MSHPRDRALGAELRAIRMNQTSLSQEDAAKLLQWSGPTMSRIETGKRHVRPEEVMAILVAYGVPVAQRDELVERSKAANQPGWWDASIPGVPHDFGALASYESEASRLTDWSLIVPGLLQTRGYARGFMSANGVAPQEVETRWMARSQRQQGLKGVSYTAYIAETALHIPFGSRAEFTEQLKHLYVMAGHEGVTIRIVPGGIAHPTMLHSFLLIEFPEAEPIAHVELVRGSLWMFQGEVPHYVRMLSDLGRLAFSAPESRDMLGKIVLRREAE